MTASRQRWRQAALLLAGAILLLLGILWGEDLDVFGNARYICLECIGLG